MKSSRMLKLIILQQNKTVIERHDFYPFGEEITTPQSKDSYLFTGKQRDSETGLDYFGARYYSPAFCRFLSTDPAPGFIADTRTLNPYIYTANNPLVYIDRDGEAVVIVAVGIGMGIAGLINGTAEVLSESIANPKAEFKDLAKAFGAGFAGGAVGVIASAGVMEFTGNPVYALPAGQAVQATITKVLKGEITSFKDLIEALPEIGLETVTASGGGKIVKIAGPRAPGRPIEVFLRRKFKNWEEILKWLKKPGTKLYINQQLFENFITTFPKSIGIISAETFWYYRQWGLYLWILSISSRESLKPTVAVEVEINWAKSLGRSQIGK